MEIQMKIVRLVTLFIMASLISGHSFAEDEKTNLAVEYLKLSNTKTTIDETIEAYVTQFAAADPNTDKAEIREFFNAYMGWDVIKEPSIQIVSNIFTQEELEAVNNFYKTKYGTAFANKSPALSAAISEIIGQNLNKAMAKMQQQ